MIASFLFSRQTLKEYLLLSAIELSFDDNSCIQYWQAVDVFIHVFITTSNIKVALSNIY